MFKKVFISILLMVSIMCVNTFYLFAEEQSVSAATQEAGVIDLKAKSALLMDAESGKILFEKNIHEKLPIASITKIMSMLLVMEAIDSGKITLDDMVQVSEHAYSMGGSQVYLKPGEQFTLHEMLKAVAIHSANDVTVALGEFVAGSEEAFVNMMNEKASALGMKDTHFLDCTGLTDVGHYSTAHDIAIMSRELITKHPKILEYTSTRRDSFRNGEFDLDNTNKLIGKYDGANGLKTGYTRAAGFCLSAAAKRNNLQLISVVLGEATDADRASESKKLLDYGFANYELTQVNNKGDLIGNVEVKKGMITNVDAVYANDVKLLLKKGEKGKLQREVLLDSEAIAPIQKGEEIGEVIYKVSENEVGRVKIVANATIEKASFFRLFFRMIIQWFGIGRK